MTMLANLIPCRDYMDMEDFLNYLRNCHPEILKEFLFFLQVRYPEVAKLYNWPLRF